MSRYPKTAATPDDQLLYRRWAGMRERCSNPNRHNFARYGGRGISVCPEWDSFDAFRSWAMVNGFKPNLTIERRNSNGNYEPDNCTWATTLEQNRNRRGVRLDPGGTPYSVIAEQNGIGAQVYYNRISAGWSPEEASSRPRLDSRDGGRTRRLAFNEVGQ